ncbi:MAG TPA: cytochrome c [Balneolaceae bacterium]
MNNGDPLNKAEKEANLVRIFLDDQKEPIVTYRPPVRFELDTTQLEDGTHTLRIEATDAVGKIGVRTVNFEVRNGPGISIDGLQEKDVLEGKVPVLINAYGGASEPFWEPSRAETPAPVPTWAWVLLLAIVGWSMVYIAQQWNPPGEFATSPTYSFYSPKTASTGPVEKPSLEAKANVGATLYRTSCATCHQANGMGVPGAFPPLAGDPVVTAEDPNRHIEIILYGLQGKAINGVDYATIMPPFAEQLSDEEVAAIINHERTSWGNNAPTVTAEDVAKVRAEGLSN